MSIGWASGGPYGGATRDIEIHPTVTNTVYVAVRQSGLYRSSDGGHHWTHVLHSGAMNVGTVHVWPANPEVVFFGGEDGLYRSDQRGDPGTWNRVTFSGHDGWQPTALAIAPSDPYVMYCAIDNTLFYTGDGGITWHERRTGLPGAPWLLSADPNDSTIAYAAFEQTGTLYKTTNAGLLWEQLSFVVPADRQR